MGFVRFVLGRNDLRFGALEFRDVGIDGDGTTILGLAFVDLDPATVAAPLERRLRVEGVKTGKVDALDTPGQIAQGLEQGILSAAEADLLLDYDRRIMHIINVDDFDPAELPAGRTPSN